MSPSRLETFSDGVFAIAATLLVLDVRVGVGDLGSALRHIWPSYAAYAVSFLTALISPTASVVLFGVITVFYIVESSVFGRSAA